MTTDKTSKEKLLPHESQMYYEIFKMFDINKKGSFGVKELSEVMASYGMKCNEQEVLEMVLIIDKGGDGRVTFEEFLEVFIRRIDSTEAQEELRDAFRVFDKEGNGFIAAHELRRVMTELGDKLTDEEVDDMIAEFEADTDGSINYEEVITILSSAHK